LYLFGDYELVNANSSVNHSITQFLIDKSFNQKIEYDQEETSQQVSTAVASVSTREIVSVNPVFDVYPPIEIDERYRIDAKPFINRPFFLQSVQWTQFIPRYSILPLTYYQLPADIINSNVSLQNGVKMGAYYRSDLSLNISVAGTITHAGIILVGVIPPLAGPLDSSLLYPTLVNTLLSGPHAFIAANEATSIKLHVPWYCNTDLATLDVSMTGTASTSVDITVKNGNYATLVMLVLNPLAPSDGSSTSLEIIVEAIFNSLDILVPSPRYVDYLMAPPTSEGKLKSAANTASGIMSGAVSDVIGDGIDMMRKSLLSFVGLHNPNNATMNTKNVVTNRTYANAVDTEQFFEKLDPSSTVDRVIDRPVFHTDIDEMSVQSIVGKPQYVGRFTVTTSNATGALLWCRPISPQHGGFTTPEYSFANNIELLHFLSRAWRGDIKIHIQSSMNNKQQVKLRLLQLYNPSTEIATGYPSYRSILNAPSHLMEFTAGNQFQTVVLPYLSRNSLMPCSRDLNTEALLHGEYYIYLAQALANSGGSPTSVEFNVYYSLEPNFSFYGYSTELAALLTPFTTPIEDGFVSETLDVMNEPQDQTQITENVQVEQPEMVNSERLIPLKSVRDYIRRMYKADTFSVNVVGGQAYLAIPLNTYVESLVSGSSLSNPMSIISAMYYGKSCGFKCKLKLSQAVNAVVSYVPQNVFVDSTTSTLKLSPINLANVDPSLTLNEYGASSNFPTPFQEFPVYNQIRIPGSTNPSVYEFVVPNTSYFKFMGGPNKLSGLPSTLATEDFGTILVNINTGSSTDSFMLDATLYLAMTDESRIGFQTIAPYVVPAQQTEGLENILLTLYSGDFTGGAASQPSGTVNPYLYFSNA